MQTFLPYSNFHLTAEVLDRKRLGKQRVEALQILRVLHTGPYICSECRESFPNDPCCGGMGKPIKTPWYNHPAVQMWKGYENGLLLYLREIYREWTRLGYKDTCWEKAQQLGYSCEHTVLLPDFIGSESFHLSHQSNLLRKYPEHYGQFFMGIPSDLPYVWPTKQL